MNDWKKRPISREERVLANLHQQGPIAMRLIWKRRRKNWFGECGKFRAVVHLPGGPLGMSHWSVYAGGIPGGSGATSSMPASKRAAENECTRFAAWLEQRRL